MYESPYRVTLSKLINQKGYSTTTENIDKLCDFFDCEVQDVMQKVKWATE
ncbi:helix-turn-helix domain-containing protein [Hydrogenovibrio marinus]|nr:hypothetical protein HVMH_0824 [Hydrogenovibrio marinus]